MGCCAYRQYVPLALAIAIRFFLWCGGKQQVLNFTTRNSLCKLGRINKEPLEKKNLLLSWIKIYNFFFCCLELSAAAIFSVAREGVSESCRFFFFFFLAPIFLLRPDWWKRLNHRLATQKRNFLKVMRWIFLLPYSRTRQPELAI